MRKPAAIAVAVAFILATLATVAFAAVPDKITIGEAKSKQPAVVFDHAKHTTLVKTCDTCHHTQKGLTKDTKTEVKKCSACHLDAKDKVPSAREMSMTKNPYHIRCIACHKTEKKGPVVCTGCHKK